MLSNSLNLYGPLNELGYGIFTRGIIKGLHEAGVFDFSINEIGKVEIMDIEELQTISSQKQSTPWDRNCPSLAIWHEFDLNKFSGKNLFAMPIFETTKFNPQAVNYLKQLDGVIVLSDWAKQVVIENIGKNTPVYVVPGASDCFDHGEYSKIQRNPESFVFYTVGKFEMRKSHIEILEAFKVGFTDHKREATLVMQVSNPFMPNMIANLTNILQQLGYKIMQHSAVEGFLVAQSGNAIVRIFKQRVHKDTLFSLYKHAHCGLFPSKAEGWNLPLMEAIKMGLPCITTGYSAHTQYVNETSKYPKELILSNLTETVANDNAFFRGDRGNWMNISTQELVEKMLYVVENYDKVEKEFKTTANYVKENFTWEKSAEKLMEVLDSHEG